MKMTEEEAKQKFCCRPLAALDISDTRCLGSSCMAWRWVPDKQTKAYLDDVQAHMKATGENFNKATQAVYADGKGKYEYTEGYCGLAGPVI